MQRASDGVAAAELADFIVAAWQTIETSLTPIIGQRSVATLYKRSCYLASRQHGWLMDVHDGVQPTMNLAKLKLALVEQASTAIAAGAGAALQVFYKVPTYPAGASLTERLLQSVWADLLPPPAQEDPA